MLLRLCFVITVALQLCSAYKPVVLIHGLFADAKSMNYLASSIQKAHPGTKITNLNIFNGISSIFPMWNQVNTARKQIEVVSRSNPNGIHIIGYSQGGLVARGVIETLANHSIDTFIAVSTPLMGEYGDPVLKQWQIVSKWLKWNVYQFFYSIIGQLSAIGGYWRDPFHLAAYRKGNKFLPFLNNEKTHLNSENYKNNFLKLKKLILIGGPQDGTIIPWQSSQFGFFKENSQTEMAEMKDQEVYKKDLFGLKTLDERGSIKTITVPNIGHNNWVYKDKVINDHILPYLI